MPDLITKRDRKKLLTDLQRIIREGTQEAERAAIQGNHYLSALDRPRGKPLELPRPSGPSYLYKAEVRDVIDADSLLLDIDLGFEVIRRQRIRLARTFLKGRYLNQELVDKGFARVV